MLVSAERQAPKTVGGQGHKSRRPFRNFPAQEYLAEAQYERGREAVRHRFSATRPKLKYPG